MLQRLDHGLESEGVNVGMGIDLDSQMIIGNHQARATEQGFAKVIRDALEVSVPLFGNYLFKAREVSTGQLQPKGFAGQRETRNHTGALGGLLDDHRNLLRDGRQCEQAMRR